MAVKVHYSRIRSKLHISWIFKVGEINQREINIFSETRCYKGKINYISLYKANSLYTLLFLSCPYLNGMKIFYLYECVFHFL